jgi:signal transduction histidine kinase/DNA-binding response OmpR family regulator
MLRLIYIYVLLLLHYCASAQQKKPTPSSQNISLLQKAEELYHKAKYDSALYLSKSILKSSKIKDSTYIESALIASLSLDKLNQPDTLGILLSARNKAYNINNLDLILKSEFAIGKRDFNNGFYSDALPRFLRLDSIAKVNNITNETVIRALIKRSEISRMAFVRESVSLAHDIMLEALEKAKAINHAALEHEIYMYLSDLSGLRNELDQAKKYADLSMSYFKQKNDVLKVDRIYHIYSIYYNATDQYDRSEASIKERITYLKGQDYKKELASAYISIGDFYKRYKSDNSLALTYYKQSEDLFDSIGDKISYRYQNLLTSMATTHASLNNFEMAYRYMNESYNVKTEYLRKQNREKSRTLETRYQTREQQNKIKLLSQQKQLAESQNAKQRNLYVGLLLLVVITVCFLIYAYRNKIKTAEKLKKLDDAKSRFFANISHEFRTPLTLIKSPVQHLQSEIKQTSQIKKLELIDYNADRMLNLVDQLLELSKLDSGQLKLVFRYVSLNSFVKQIVDSFQYQAKEKQISFSSVYPKDDCWGWVDIDMLHKVLSNLLGNALKYTPKGQRVKIQTDCDSKLIHFEITNSGVNLTQGEAHNMFDRFYQKNNESGGVGIGLAFVKELVNHIQGQISPQVTNHSLIITLDLPVEKSRLQPFGLILDSSPSRADVLTDQMKNKVEFHGDDQILLIVDDNASVREVCRQLFEDNFKILESDNGEDAFELASTHVPDLIISDVMMPKLNGYQLTSKIKNDVVTSSIPVILLTAKSGDDARLSGIESEADAYLTKPFNHKILIAKVNQILNERTKLQERYSQELILKPTGLSVDSVNEEFIKHLESILEEHISDSQFNTQDFADKMNMSRMQLHRKLKTLFGVSASQFIRNERLKAAAELLKQKDVTISDVAYKVGFNDVGYFSKCFKKLYHLIPSDYQKTQN